MGTVDAAPLLCLAIPPILLRRTHVEEAGELYGADAAYDLDAVVPRLPVEPHPNLRIGDFGVQRRGGADVIGLGGGMTGDGKSQGNAGGGIKETGAHVFVGACDNGRRINMGSDVAIAWQIHAPLGRPPFASQEHAGGPNPAVASPRPPVAQAEPLVLRRLPARPG